MGGGIDHWTKRMLLPALLFASALLASACIEPVPQLGCQPYLDAEPDAQWVTHRRMWGFAPNLSELAPLGGTAFEEGHMYPFVDGETCERGGCMPGAYFEMEFDVHDDVVPFELEGQRGAHMWLAGDYCEQSLQPQPAAGWSVRFDVWEERCIMGEFLNLGPEFEHLEGRFFISRCD